MLARNELERLAAVGRPLLSAAESLVDANEEERILAGILASTRRHTFEGRRRRRPALVLGVAVLAAVGTVAATEIGQGNRSTTATVLHRHHGVILSGAKIEFAGYHFRTPAGFKRTTSACLSAPDATRPRPAIDGFAGAASADGGCLEAVYFVGANKANFPTDAVPADVGTYHGYYVSPDSSGTSALYVNLPNAAGPDRVVYLILFARNLTEDQLVAVAASGLPTLPPSGPTTTTGMEGSG